ncbi:MAG: hypothetical protein ACREYE_20270, partial [Gammaproteobacteria bacterium]
WPALVEWGMPWVEHIGGLYPLNHRRRAVLDQPAAFAECDARLRAEVQAMARRRDEQLADPTLPMTAKKTRESLDNHWQLHRVKERSERRWLRTLLIAHTKRRIRQETAVRPSSGRYRRRKANRFLPAP